MKYVVTETLSKLAPDFDFTKLLMMCSVFGDDNECLKFANGEHGYCVIYNPWGYGLAGITHTVAPTEFYSVTHGDGYNNARVIFCTFDEVAYALNFDEEEDYDYKEVGQG